MSETRAALIGHLKIKYLFNLKTFSKILTLLRLISSLRVTDNMYTNYNLIISVRLITCKSYQHKIIINKTCLTIFT